MRNAPLLCAVLGVVAGFAHSQGPVVSFPADVVQVDPQATEVVLLPRLGEFASLMTLGQTTFTDLVLPSGAVVDLDLTPLDLTKNQFTFQVNGEPRPDLLDDLDLSVWVGSVVGDSTSEAYLSFSTAGSRGWVKTGGVLWHLLAAPGVDNDWSASTIRIVAEEQLLEDGRELGDFCAAERLAGHSLVDDFVQPPVTSAPSGAGIDVCSLKNCKIALECDWQLYQVWNDLAAETAYLTTLLSWVSCRFEQQVQTILTFPYLQIWTISNDPWTTQDTGGDCVLAIQELAAAWAPNMPANASIGHMLSADLGCGVAWVNVLCDDDQRFSVSGCIDGSLQFPIQQQSGNWDFYVIAHELGHNFGALHTHDLGIDQCFSGYCISNGTLMSYCHACPGGTANITTFFNDPIITGILQNGAQTCLADYSGSSEAYCTALVNSLGCTPAISSSGSPTIAGANNFFVLASGFVGAKAGTFFFGSAGEAAIPFLGGTLCVTPPLARTSIQFGGGTDGTCSGTYSYHFTQAAMSAFGISAGDVVHGQWWTRDPDAVQQAGLSDGLEITVCN